MDLVDGLDSHVSASMWRDPWLAVALVAAPLVGGLLGPAVDPDRWAAPHAVLMATAIHPLLEELCFRGLLQGWLLEHLPRLRAGPVSAANALSSIAFAAAHLPTQAAGWAAATALPSLLLGCLRERHGSLALPIGLHAFFNASLILGSLHLR